MIFLGGVVFRKKKNNRKKGKIGAAGAAFVTMLSASFLTGCGTGKVNTCSLFAMDTVMELQISGSEALLTEGENRIRNLEKLLSVTDENSEISQLNRTGEGRLSDDPSQLLKEALEICDRTDGALDITIYPVLKEWGFTTGAYKVPEEGTIETLLENVDYGKVEFDAKTNTCTIPDGMQVDLGSVAKGYTSRELSRYFKENGVKSGLINLGGNVECIGRKPSGDAWRVAVKSPFKDSASGIFGVIEAEDEAIVTSGGYERFFEKDGETYWHILDPKNGHPAKNGLLSVTIVGKDALLCDGLSTALFVKGLDEAISFYKENSDFEAVFITDSGECYVTQNIADRFSLTSEYYDVQIHVINK